MKKIFKSLMVSPRERTRTIYSLCLVLLVGLVLPIASLAQTPFVKTYASYSTCTQTRGNLEFNCITKSKSTTPTYFVAGLQDTSVYVAEINANGVVLQEKLIGVRSRNYSLRSMITDDDGNIVIVGTATNAYPYISFLMKISPALSLVLHRTYNNLLLTGTSQMAFMDVKDLKSENSYYIGGVLRLNTNAGGSDGLLLRVDRNTGIVQAINKTNAGEDAYDALTFGIERIGTDNLPAILATGRFSGSSAATMRPWLNKHNNALQFALGNTQIRTTAVSARLYSSSLILDPDNSNVLYCWLGQLAGTANIGGNVGLASYKEFDLSTVWQNEYVFSPQPVNLKLLNKIASDKGGYVAEGNFWNGTLTGQGGGSVGEMILLRVDKNGNPVWSRKINNVLVNSQTHNAAFVIDGGFILSVGKKLNSTTTFSEGALVKIPLANGAMDTTCASVLKVTVNPVNYNVAAQATNAIPECRNTMVYNPILCTTTDTVTNCNQPCPDTVKLNADFNLFGGLLAGNNTDFQVYANGFATTPNSQWIVSRTTTNTASSPDLASSVYPSVIGGTWATATLTQFGGYNGTTSLTGSEVNTPTPNSFLIANRYRFRHILSITNNCGITRSDTVVKTISMCPGCKSKDGNKFVVETEKGSAWVTMRKTTESVTLPEQRHFRVMPNPASTGTISIDYTNARPGAVTVKIADIQGKTVAAKQFSNSAKGMNKYSMDVSTLSNGTYTITILNEGNISVQKLVVAN